MCRDDCPGLCSECGARLEEDPGHAHESADPRWAALTKLTERPDGRAAEKSDDESDDPREN